MIRVALLSAGLLLTACSERESNESLFNAQAKADEQAAKQRVADQAAMRAGFQPAQPAPLATVSVDPVKAPAPGAILPPSDRQYRYIGRWAVTPELCARGAWKFQVRKLTTAGETSCDLPTVAATPSGYALSGLCRAEGEKSDQTLRLRFDDAKRTMSVESRTLGPVDLIYCGD